MGWLVGLLVFAGVLVAWFASMYNGLVNLRNRFKNAFAQIDVQLKRRYGSNETTWTMQSFFYLFWRLFGSVTAGALRVPLVVCTIPLGRQGLYNGTRNNTPFCTLVTLDPLESWNFFISLWFCVVHFSSLLFLLLRTCLVGRRIVLGRDTFLGLLGSASPRARSRLAVWLCSYVRGSEFFVSFILTRA